MKRADPDPRAGQESRDALGHLAGRLICEGDRQHTGRIDPLFNNAGDAACNDAGFSGTGAGDDQERPFGLFDGPSLAGGQIVRAVHSERSLVSAPKFSVSSDGRSNLGQGIGPGTNLD